MSIKEKEIQFGKYKGRTWDDIVYIDPQYVDWVVDNANHKSLTNEDKEELIEALNDSGYGWTRN